MIIPSVVRQAGPADREEVWRLFLEGWRENGLFPMDNEKVQWFMDRCLNHDQIPPLDTGTRGVISVIGPVGALEALLFVTIGEFWYSRSKHLEEMILLVDEKHRKSGHAQALIDYMKKQVEITGLPLLTGILSINRIEAKCRLYQRKLPKIGEFFFVTPKGSKMSPALSMVSS